MQERKNWKIFFAVRRDTSENLDRRHDQRDVTDPVDNRKGLEMVPELAANLDRIIHSPFFAVADVPAPTNEEKKLQTRANRTRALLDLSAARYVPSGKRLFPKEDWAAPSGPRSLVAAGILEKMISRLRSSIRHHRPMRSRRGRTMRPPPLRGLLN